MKEQTQTTIFGILKLIPFAIVTAIIVLFWVDDFYDCSHFLLGHAASDRLFDSVFHHGAALA